MKISISSSGTSNLASFLLEGKDASCVALHLIDRDATYGDLRATSESVARYLVNAGAQKGDRVLLAADNSLFWVAAYLGILQAGMVCVPLPVGIAADDLAYILHITGCRCAFVSPRLAVSHAEQLYNLAIVTDRAVTSIPHATSFADIQSQGSDATDFVNVEPDDLAALMFTSGSTGNPRGVMVSHANIIANTESIVEYLRLTSQDRIMTVLPFHYCFGTSLLHTHLRVGASLVIDPRFMYPEKILDRMIETECTGFAGVPSHFQILLRKTSFSRRQFAHLRYVQQAGGHLAPSFVRELRAALPNTSIFVMYGQTEATARLSYVPPDQLERKLGSIGKAIPGVQLQVVDDSGKAAQPGEVGEIAAEGANVTRGYWDEPEESARCFRNGKLYTGDLGTIDDEGFFYVLDRAKDFLKCGGKRVSCRQLEETLLEFDELLETAIVGMKDEILGEAVKAFVVPRSSNVDGLEQRVLAFCKEHFAHSLVPKQIVVLNSLPKSSSGKVSKQKLRASEAGTQEVRSSMENVSS